MIDHALFMLYPCFIHALFMLYPCFIHALSMLYLCLSMRYPCLLHTLSHYRGEVGRGENVLQEAK